MPASSGTNTRDFLAFFQDKDVRADFLEQVQEVGAQDDRHAFSKRHQRNDQNEQSVLEALHV